MIQFKEEICNYLRLPDLPKKKWDGKSSFDYGAAVVTTRSGDECFAVVSFNSSEDDTPKIRKVFGYEIVTAVKEVFVVPAYMDDSNIDKMDLDEESKKRAKEISDEAKEIENAGTEEGVDIPENEYFFDMIHNDDEARAFIESYNKKNKIKGGVPRKHDTIVMRLGVIWSEFGKKNA